MAEVRSDSPDSAQVLLGILALLAADRDERVEGATPRRTELILEEAGFSAREISQITGKNYESVRSTLRRASQAGKKG